MHTHSLSPVMLWVKVAVGWHLPRITLVERWARDSDPHLWLLRFMLCSAAVVFLVYERKPGHPKGNLQSI